MERHMMSGHCGHVHKARSGLRMIRQQARLVAQCVRLGEPTSGLRHGGGCGQLVLLLLLVAEILMVVLLMLLHVVRMLQP